MITFDDEVLWLHPRWPPPDTSLTGSIALGRCSYYYLTRSFGALFTRKIDWPAALLVDNRPLLHRKLSVATENHLSYSFLV
jgi:hypothetical protein